MMSSPTHSETSTLAQMPERVSAVGVGGRCSEQRRALVDQAVAVDEQDQVLAAAGRTSDRPVVGGPRGEACREPSAGRRRSALGGEHAELVVGLGEVDAASRRAPSSWPESAPSLEESISRSLSNSPMPPPVAPRSIRSASTFGTSMPSASTPLRRSRIEPARVVSETSSPAAGRPGATSTSSTRRSPGTRRW